MLDEWNDTDTPYPRLPCRRADRRASALRPDEVAVASDERSLTYGELDVRANALAHHLQALGVGPDVLVAICVERSLDMVVGLLGIMSAGGAYVPVDPGFPRDRQQFMLEDAGVQVVVTQERLLPQLPTSTEQQSSVSIAMRQRIIGTNDVAATVRRRRPTTWRT